MPALAVMVAGCSDDDPEPEPVIPEEEPVGSEWIDEAFALKLQEAEIIEDAMTVTPSMVRDVKSVNVAWSDLESIRGIERFDSLEELICDHNKLTELDLSGLTHLQTIDAGYMKTLTSANLNGCSALTTVEISNCNLAELDIAGCTSVVWLSVGNNELTTLNVTGKPDLEYLYCYGNYLTSINLKTCPKLTNIICFDNLLKGLDIRVNRKLTMLYTMFNPGLEGCFEIKAWFDNDNVPYNFTTSSWVDGGVKVTVKYVKVV